MLYSKYGTAAWLVAEGAFLFVALAAAVPLALLLLLARPTPAVARTAAALLGTIAICVIFMFAFIAGFDKMPVAVSSLLGLLTAAVASIPIAVLVSPFYANVFRRRTDAIPLPLLSDQQRSSSAMSAHNSPFYQSTSAAASSYHEIGEGLGGSSGAGANRSLGGLGGFDAKVNQPVAATATGGETVEMQRRLSPAGGEYQTHMTSAESCDSTLRHRRGMGSGGAGGEVHLHHGGDAGAAVSVDDIMLSEHNHAGMGTGFSQTQSGTTTAAATAAPSPRPELYNASPNTPAFFGGEERALGDGTARDRSAVAIPVGGGASSQRRSVTSGSPSFPQGALVGSASSNNERATGASSDLAVPLASAGADIDGVVGSGQSPSFGVGWSEDNRPRASQTRGSSSAASPAETQSPAHSAHAAPQRIPSLARFMSDEERRTGNAGIGNGGPVGDPELDRHPSFTQGALDPNGNTKGQGFHSVVSNGTGPQNRGVASGGGSGEVMEGAVVRSTCAIDNEGREFTTPTTCLGRWIRVWTARWVWWAFAVSCAIGVFITAVANVSVFGSCYCTQPTTYTTMMSRAFQSNLCQRGQPCHFYPMLGDECDAVSVVAHFVSSDGEDGAPRSAIARVFAGNKSTLLDPSTGHLRTNATTGAALVAPAMEVATVPGFARTAGSSGGAVSVAGDVVAEEPINEDHRVVARIPLIGLSCGAQYIVKLSFYTNDHSRPLAETAFIQITTLPAAVEHHETTSPSSASTVVNVSHPAIDFVGGGDIKANGYGLDILKLALALRPSAYFVYIGGDVAYANNIRRCYRRWDDTLGPLAALRRGDGSTPLLLATVGNHEAGGYLLAKTKKERLDRYHAFTTFLPGIDFMMGYRTFPAATFPSSAAWLGDRTVTFSRASIGVSRWVVLDSGTMLSCESQAPLLHETLAAWAPPSSTSSTATQVPVTGGVHSNRSSIKVLVGMYHNAGFPSVRSFDDVHAADVRSHFVPPMLRANVSLILENHDHAYKRTVPLQWDGATNTAVQSTTTGGGGGRWVGTIISGDGALGVAESPRSTTRLWYHAVVEEGDYVLLGRLTDDGTIAAHVVRPDGTTRDRFDIAPRP